MHQNNAKRTSCSFVAMKGSVSIQKQMQLLARKLLTLRGEWCAGPGGGTVGYAAPDLTVAGSWSEIPSPSPFLLTAWQQAPAVNRASQQHPQQALGSPTSAPRSCAHLHAGPCVSQGGFCRIYWQMYLWGRLSTEPR